MRIMGVFRLSVVFYVFGVVCCTDYDVICVYRGVFRGYLVDIAVLFCSYWSKMEYMSILSVQLWHGVLSACYGGI